MTNCSVDFSVACAFMETVLPNEMSLKQRRTMHLRFYSWLYVHGTSYRLVFVCPYCKRRRGACRCPQLGHTLAESPWVYETDPLAVIHWRITTVSLLRVDASWLDLTSAHGRRLSEFISYVKRLNEH